MSDTQLDAARHAYERVCFTRYALDTFSGRMKPADIQIEMAKSMESFDYIVENAHRPGKAKIYAEKRTETHDYRQEYVDWLNRMSAKNDR